MFTARTESSGTIAPGTGLPANSATLSPSSVPIIAGAPTWSPLGSSSNTCYQSGCGYTGWVQSDYTISTAGQYYLKFGVTNWNDTQYNTGMALDAVSVNNVQIAPTPMPEPTSLLLLGTGLVGMGLLGRRRSKTS